MNLAKRLYHLRPLTAVLLCLLGVLPCLWYLWQGYAAFGRYRRSTGEDRSLSLEDLQLQVHDLLRRDLRRVVMPSWPTRSKVERLSFHLKAQQMDTLLKGAQKESNRPYVTATLETGGRTQELKLRLRGLQHWHLLGKKKSLKVRLPKGALIDGQRVFNLINDPSPLVVGEQIILDLASEQGILTPRSSFARVQLNGANLGLFRYTAQPDEGVLRLNQRMPGSIYSGNLPKSAQTKELWNHPVRWKKVAWRNRAEKEDRSELQHLLDQINRASVAQFTDFARQTIDLDAFATFEALDIIFGGDQHDFRQNHKLYLDPYRGRWEPVAWNFRGYKHEPAFNLVENPLLLRLKMVPEYLSLRNRILYRLLVNSCSPSSIQERATQLLKNLAPELAADPFWQAYKQPSWQVLKGQDPLMATSQEESADLYLAIDLFPRVALVARKNPSPKRGEVRSQVVPVAYSFSLRSSCLPEVLTAEGIHLATRSKIRSLAVPTYDVPLPKQVLSTQQTPRLTAGEIAPHPQSLELPPPEIVRFGPGRVDIPHDMRFAAHQTVQVAPGTQLKLAERTSLIFYGPVFFNGSRKEPISITSASQNLWGGIAIQGPATAGSCLKYVHAISGSVPGSRSIPYPGMINIHDTDRIAIEHCRFGGTRDSEDVVHLAYVTGLSIDDVRIEKAQADAFDLEFTQGIARGLWIQQAGDEGIDCMGSEIEIVDSLVLACTGNAISAGEESQIVIRDTLLADSTVGVLAKNASRVNLTGSLLYQDKTGIEVYSRTLRFEGDSQVRADVLFVVDSQNGIKRADRSSNRLDQGRIQRRLPPAGILSHLLRNVLELDHWAELPGWLEDQKKGASQ